LLCMFFMVLGPKGCPLRVLETQGPRGKNEKKKEGSTPEWTLERTRTYREGKEDEEGRKKKRTGKIDPRGKKSLIA